MAKRYLMWDENKLNKWLQEGRGRGYGASYKPWLTIQDYPSLGRATRCMGWTTQRMHHLFTDSELRYFYLLDWEPAVVDIREHYPMLDLYEVIKNKGTFNLELFKDKRSGVPYILSTTFLITVRRYDGTKINVARSLKSSSELEKKISLEKYELERQYYRALGIDWALVTHKEIPIQRAKNIEWIHSSLNSYEERGLSKEELDDLCEVFCERLINNVNPVRTITLEFDKDYGLESGTALFLFKYLIAARKIEVNMDKPISLSSSATEIMLSISKIQSAGDASCFI